MGDIGQIGTRREARHVLAGHAAEIVRLWSGGSASFFRRLLDATDLDVSEIAWEETESDAQSDDASFRVSWWYLFCFLDAARGGLEDLDDIPWPEAVAVMGEVAQRLMEGQPIDKALILRHAPSEEHGRNQ